MPMGIRTLPLHVRWTRPGTIHLWAFDLLAVNGRDLRSRPLVKRQECLQVLLERFDCPAISQTLEEGMARCVELSNGPLKVSSASAAMRHTVPASAGIGARSRSLRGVRPIGKGSDYSSVVIRSVADGIHEWERKNRSAFFVRDDKRAAVRWKSVTNALAHALASECRRLIPCRSQIVKLDTFPVKRCSRHCV